MLPRQQATSSGWPPGTSSKNADAIRRNAILFNCFGMDVDDAHAGAAPRSKNRCAHAPFVSPSAEESSYTTCRSLAEIAPRRIVPAVSTSRSLHARAEEPNVYTASAG